jgi:hypothetical protein
VGVRQLLGLLSRQGCVSLAWCAVLLTGCEPDASAPQQQGKGKRADQTIGVAARTGPDEPASQNAAAPGRPVDKTFDDIKFDIQKGESFERTMLGADVKQLFNKPIRIRGYIFPTFRSKGIKEFVLVRDNQECCFGPGAALYDCIRVTLEQGTSIAYTRAPVAVEGVFRLDEKFVDPDRTVGAVFHLADASVE